MAWKRGPLPLDTYNWGGVVPAGSHPSKGFYFADFCGDHVKVVPDGKILQAHEVAWYDNSLELPPGIKGRSNEPITWLPDPGGQEAI